MLYSKFDEKEVNSQNLLYRVYGWMFAGLSITASIAYMVSNSPALVSMIYSGWAPMLLLVIVQLALVVALSVFLPRLSFSAAVGLFLLYSATMGATMASIFLVFTASSIFVTFLVAAGMFGATSLYGYFTNADLSKMGSILFMAVIGILIALVVNMFIQSSRLDMLISFIGVIVFTLLTAYDTQKIKMIAQRLINDHEMIGKVALFGALALYLDFINLFLFLLRFTGQRRSE